MCYHFVELNRCLLSQVAALIHYYPQFNTLYSFAAVTSCYRDKLKAPMDFEDEQLFHCTCHFVHRVGIKNDRTQKLLLLFNKTKKLNRLHFHPLRM